VCGIHETSFKRKNDLMKTRNFLIGMMTAAAVLTMSSCENALLDQKDNNAGIIPERFKVDIPTSLSNGDLNSASLKSTAMDTLNGNHIYAYLNAFIAVGDGAADMVQAIMLHIRAYKIENVISLSYTSQDDHRVKNLDVLPNVNFEGRTWEYQLTITDAESEGNPDGGIGLQIFWNKSPIEGIAIFKPYNIDRIKNADSQNAMASIEYSEKGTGDYESYMIVELAGFPFTSSVTNPFALESMKMFVGKKGNVVDVIGNSNHPNARFNIYDTHTTGFDWSFVACGDRIKNIAVAEVGLPYSTADLTTRTAILEDNSIKKVLTREMTNFVVAAYASVGITLQPDEISNYLTPYLKNADAPGYFANHGFISGGTAPNDNYAPLVSRIQDLVPYNPKDISNLQIQFNY
jgi:hypothetical protein